MGGNQFRLHVKRRSSRERKGKQALGRGAIVLHAYREIGHPGCSAHGHKSGGGLWWRKI